MIRIIIGPEAINKKGLDNIMRPLIKRLRKHTDKPYCEVLFLIGVKKSDINYIMTHIFRILDMGMTIMTQVEVKNIPKQVDFQGNELGVTIKAT